ncbi:hypothetical protein LSH36_75g11010 [Paralvinella palmiformis]|uniref:Uncharacterized protein n=1 Tax=Paralvinella palmiformis TaxID=53620 RepID=A0AAD9NB22_9ANNE|nr:hypothetical protein LSH36_75g11010 [Paralvinella palmiformis]
MELAVWRGTKIDCSPSDGGLKWAGSWLVCTGIVLILASCLRCRVTASMRLKRGPPTELKRPSFHQRNDADKLNNRGYYPDSKDLQQPKHSQIYIIHALVYHSHRNISCLDYSSVNAVRQIHLPTPATYKRRLRQRRRAVHDKESSRSEFEMGSGEIADSNHLPRELTPGGNDTVEAGDIGGDHGANMEVTVPENHPVVNDSTETSERLVNSDIDPTTEKGSTAMLSSTIETTTKATTVPVVIVSDKAPKPPYVIVTHSERSDVTTTHNMTEDFESSIAKISAIQCSNS